MVSCRVSEDFSSLAPLPFSITAGGIRILQKASYDGGGVWEDPAEIVTIYCRDVCCERRESRVRNESRSLQHMDTNSLEISRTFVNAWQATLRVHELMAENRLRFAQRLNEMADELANLAKEVDKSRKQVSITLCFSDRGYFLESE